MSDLYLIHGFCFDFFWLLFDFGSFHLLSYFFNWLGAFKPLKTTKEIIKIRHLLFQGFFSANNPYFALKELIVGNDQLFFLCCFSHIFDVSQQLVLTEELRRKTDDSKHAFCCI